MSSRDTWLNNLNATNLSSVTNQGVYVVVVVGLALVAAILLLRKDANGLILGQTILGTALVKSTVTAGSRLAKRLTDRGYVEAKERAKAATTPAVVVDAKDQAKVEVKTEPGHPVPLTSDAVEERHWATGDPRAGIL